MGNVKSLQSWWVTDLVDCVAQEDRQGIRAELGYPQVANGFKRVLGDSTDALDVGGYSGTEVAAMAQAIEWLKQEEPDLYSAVRQYMRTRVQTDVNLYAAFTMLGQKVDEVLG